MGRRAQRLVSSVNDWIAKFNAQRIDDMMIEALWVDGNPIYTLEQASVIIGAMDANMNLIQIVNAAGEVTEASAAGAATTLGAISGFCNNLNWGVRNQNPLSYTAAGVLMDVTAAQPWTPIPPQVVTADGAGDPPDTVLVPLNAGDLIDVMLFIDVVNTSGAGQHEFNFRTDPLAAVGGISPVVPPWNGFIIPMQAGGTTPQHTYGHRMITDTVASAFGLAEGAAGDWPNAEPVAFTGFYRYI